MVMLMMMGWESSQNVDFCPATGLRLHVNSVVPTLSTYRSGGKLFHACVILNAATVFQRLGCIE